MHDTISPFHARALASPEALIYLTINSHRSQCCTHHNPRLEHTETVIVLSDQCSQDLRWRQTGCKAEDTKRCAIWIRLTQTACMHRAIGWWIAYIPDTQGHHSPIDFRITADPEMIAWNSLHNGHPFSYIRQRFCFPIFAVTPAGKYSGPPPHRSLWMYLIPNNNQS